MNTVIHRNIPFLHVHLLSFFYLMLVDPLLYATFLSSSNLGCCFTALCSCCCFVHNSGPYSGGGSNNGKWDSPWNGRWWWWCWDTAAWCAIGGDPIAAVVNISGWCCTEWIWRTVVGLLSISSGSRHTRTGSCDKISREQKLIIILVSETLNDHKWSHLRNYCHCYCQPTTRTTPNWWSCSRAAAVWPLL